MGYFLDINNSSDRAQGVAEYNRANGKSGHTLLGVTLSQYGPSIFMGLAQKIASSSDGKGGSDKDVSVDEQKKTLEKQLNKALSAIGAKNVSEIDKKVKDQQDEVTAAKTEYDKYTNKQDSYTIDIANLESKKATGTNLTEEQIAQNNQIDKQIKAKQKERENALKKAEKKYNNELKALQEMSVNADKANNINIQLKNLKALDESKKETTNYDVKQEITDLSDFNKAMTNFLKNKNKQTAKALKDAYENVDSENTQNAYKRLEKDVNTYLQ